MIRAISAIAATEGVAESLVLETDSLLVTENPWENVGKNCQFSHRELLVEKDVESLEVSHKFSWLHYRQQLLPSRTSLAPALEHLNCRREVRQRSSDKNLVRSMIYMK